MINFNNPYNRTDFLRFLEEQFLPDDFRIDHTELEDLGFSARYTVKANKLGTCRSLELDVFEITHTSTHDARVGIAQDAFRLMLHKSYYNRALVIFKQEDNPQYRFSLLQIEAEQAETSSRITRSFSNPRRYSFLLGEGAHVKTPTQFLIEDGKLTTKNGTYFEDLQKRFSVEVLTKLFYKELSDWYFWALKQVEFPSKPTSVQALQSGKELEDLIKEHNATNVIRMLTRILFVWFIKQKGLIPEELFDEQELKNNILTELNPIKQTGLFSGVGLESVYYKAILQNLFFASLNCPIKPQSDDEDKRERGFRRENIDFGNDWLFRYKKSFKNPDTFVGLINSKVPFLNGGLFECLDDKHNKIYIDGFTDNLPKNQRLIVPDYIFFGKDENVDLSDDYGENTPQAKQASVKGLINILKTYNFTVEENTPAEVEVALDPELLGKVFENLLASFNPETKTTARKQTGSFYTPREIVNYMVDESLIAYFKGKTSIEEEKIRALFKYTDEEPSLSEAQTDELVNALYDCKILDPACGSGAFPMGILQKLVHVLQKADPQNLHWKKVQHEKAQSEIQQALDIEDKKDRENRLIEINNAFDITKNTPDYARKLFLIENCIYGVDIQPIATQISKLRFFISLVVDQKNNATQENFGIIPLPNLETKFVTANTLIGINKPTGQLSLSNTDELKRLQEELRKCRHKIFGAKTKRTKQKYRAKDQELRNAIADELKNNGWNNADADNLAGWDPYNQNSSSPFFDPEWMFGLQRESEHLNSAGGFFSIVLGNPPYVNVANIKPDKYRNHLRAIFYSARNKSDLYAFFIEKGFGLLNSKGILSYIIPHTWKATDSFKNLREIIFKNHSVCQIVNLDMTVFDAIVQPLIIILNNQLNKNYQIPIYDKHFKYIYSIDVQEIINDELLSVDTTSTKKQKNIFVKIETNTTPLNQIIEFSRGIKTSNDKRFISTENKDGNTKKIFRGKNIKAYSLNWANEYIWYRPDLMREKVGCVTHTNSFFEVPEKLVTQRVNSSMQLLVAYDNKQNYFLDTTNVSKYNSWNKIVSLRFLCGLLNSKLINFWYSNKYRMPTIGIYELHSIPIKIEKNIEKLIITLVNQILEAKQENPQADTSDWENEIDQLVYQLYGLTDEEIAVVEGK